MQSMESCNSSNMESSLKLSDHLAFSVTQTNTHTHAHTHTHTDKQSSAHIILQTTGEIQHHGELCQLPSGAFLQVYERR